MKPKFRKSCKVNQSIPMANQDIYMAWMISMLSAGAVIIYLVCN